MPTRRLTSMNRMDNVSAEKSQARLRAYTSKRKMAKQNVLFMMAAPSRVAKEIEMVFFVFFRA
jgi:hypothetical protein